jgi:hypothetical protein
VTAALWHLARWLAWQVGELDRPAKRPLANITVFSTADKSA